MEQVVLSMIDSINRRRRKITVLYQFPFSLDVFEKYNFEIIYDIFPNSILSGGELRAEVMANYLRHEHLPDGTFLSENARYQQTYGMLPEEGVIIQQSYNKSQAASFLAA
jgi:hypothetical protein